MTRDRKRATSLVISRSSFVTHMLHGKVIGTATSTVKHPSMDGWKLLVVRTDKNPDNDPVLAVDTQGAGVGDDVVISSDGKFTSKLIGTKVTPVRWSVIGIIDN